MKELQLLALDLGASNGRAMMGRFDGKRITLQEAYRFENNYVAQNGVYYWNILGIYSHIKQGFQQAKALYGQPDAFGIDTWGVDYGLLDKNGALISNPRSYWYTEDGDMEAVWQRVPRRTLFDRTGAASMCYNTVYQLCRLQRDNAALLELAETMLFMPDLLGYFFTGEKASEYTITTTGMLYHPGNKTWDYESIMALGLPTKLFTEIQPSGIVRGRLLHAVAEELGMGQIPFATVGEHDTASAVASIPGKGDFAFCSSGTWSLFGVETDAPVLTDEVYDANFSNEGTVQGGFRPLKNIMGLWIIQECRRDWQKQGEPFSWDDIVNAAEKAAPFRSIFDPERPEFFAAGGMVKRIQAYCERTAQPIPQTMGQVARCVYESLALKYRWALTRLEAIKGGPITSLNIVGGGIQNRLLNQMVANSIDRPVITGPIEGAAMGNALMQAMALGEIGDIEELREVARNSVETEQYLPKDTAAWQDAYGRMEKLMEEPV